MYIGLLATAAVADMPVGALPPWLCNQTIFLVARQPSALGRMTDTAQRIASSAATG